MKAQTIAIGVVAAGVAYLLYKHFSKKKCPCAAKTTAATSTATTPAATTSTTTPVTPAMPIVTPSAATIAANGVLPK